MNSKTDQFDIRDHHNMWNGIIHKMTDDEFKSPSKMTTYQTDSFIQYESPKNSVPSTSQKQVKDGLEKHHTRKLSVYDR